MLRVATSFIIQTKTLLKVIITTSWQHPSYTASQMTGWQEHIGRSQYHHEGHVHVFWGLNVSLRAVSEKEHEAVNTLNIKVNLFLDKKEITTKWWKLGDPGPFLLRSIWEIYQKPVIAAWLPSPPGTFCNFQISQGGANQGPWNQSFTMFMIDLLPLTIFRSLAK